MATGIVKFFNYTKGYGFIIPSDGSKEIFVHSVGVNESIKKGDRVSYTVEKGPKGLNAVNVSLMSTTSMNPITRFICAIASKLGLGCRKA